MKNELTNELKDHICDTLAEVEEKAEERLEVETDPEECEQWTAVLNLCRCVKLLADETFAAGQKIKELGEQLREAKKAAGVKEGEWERKDWLDEDNGVFTCTSCGESFVLTEGTPEDNGYLFCPKCASRNTMPQKEAADAS